MGLLKLLQRTLPNRDTITGDLTFHRFGQFKEWLIDLGKAFFTKTTPAKENRNLVTICNLGFLPRDSAELRGLTESKVVPLMAKAEPATMVRLVQGIPAS